MASSWAQVAPLRLKGAPVSSAAVSASSIPSTTGRAASPSPSQVTCSGAMGAGSGAVWIASSTALKGAVAARGHSSGTSGSRTWASRFSTRSVRSCRVSVTVPSGAVRRRTSSV